MVLTSNNYIFEELGVTCKTVNLILISLLKIEGKRVYYVYIYIILYKYTTRFIKTNFSWHFYSSIIIIIVVIINKTNTQNFDD